tara:strand:+ start:15536 stop:16672 length:1137 start_codon:yes stop_codon:yes gene_type:complete
MIITSVPVNISTWLKGQPKYLSKFFQVEIITSFSSNIKEIENYEGVKINTIPLTRKITPFRDIISLYKIIKYLNKFQPDIVYSMNPKSGLLGMLAARIVNTPIRMHCIVGLVGFGSQGLKKRILIWSEKLTYYFSTNLYANSKSQGEYIAKNLTSKNIKTIGHGSINGVDTSFFLSRKSSFEKQKIKKELNFTSSDFVITFIGRIVKDKGIDDLVSAFLKLSLKQENLKLLIIGSYDDNLNPINKITKDEIEKSKNIKRINFQHDIRKFLEITSLFVLPSHREGFPNVLLEAGSFGIPIVASNINGCNEVIEHGTNGLLFEKKDIDGLVESINIFLTNNEFYNSSKLNIRNTVISKYSQDRFHSNLYVEIDRLISLNS